MVEGREKAKVSVLLPTFNRARYITAAIGSLLSQHHKPFEIIVLDDGSTDETASICARFGERVTYVQIGMNGGKTAAINLGISLARGDFIWIMDDDDIAPPIALSLLLMPLLSDPGTGFSFGRLRKFSINANGDLRFGDASGRAEGPDSLFVQLMEDCFITGQPCTLFRRSCLESLAPFDTSVLASVDYNILLQAARHYRGADVGKVVLWQRQHDGTRGPAGLQYSAQDRIERWREFDRRLIAGLIEQLGLHEYLGMTAPRRPLSPGQVRSALIQKAVIAGRKDLWEIAIDCLRSAVAAAPGKPFTPRDLETLTRILGSRYGIDALLADVSVQDGLATAAGLAAGGHEVRVAAASLLTFLSFRMLRKGDLGRMASCIAAMLRIAGARGAMTLIGRAATRRMRTPGLSNPAVGAARSAGYAAE
jgi:hypothetical protein